MSLRSKKLYVGVAAPLGAAALGLWLGGAALAAYAALSVGTGGVAGALWLETRRLRRAQATRFNRVAYRITSLEQQVANSQEHLLSQQADLVKHFDHGFGELQREQGEALRAAVREVLDGLTAEATARERAVGELREAFRESASSVLEGVDDGLRRTRDELENIGRNENRILYNKVEGLLALYRDIEPDWALPAMHGWAITSDFARMLYREVIDNERSQILECGSGSTTLILAYALRARGTGRIVSLEHQAEFVDATKRMLADHGVAEWAEVVHAPLVDVDIEGTTWRWYDPAAIPEGAIDMLLVDGPPGTTGPLARYPALPVLARRLTPDAVIMLDDADREDERAVKRRWTAELDGYSAKFAKTDCGALVLRPKRG